MLKKETPGRPLNWAPNSGLFIKSGPIRVQFILLAIFFSFFDTAGDSGFYVPIQLRTIAQISKNPFVSTKGLKLYLCAVAFIEISRNRTH